VGFRNLGFRNSNKAGLLMVTMPRENIEEQPDAMPGVSMRSYVTQHATRNRRDIPGEDHVEGQVEARLYRGLWITDCPEEGCANACVVSSVEPVYLCPDCGAGWFDVVFPSNKSAIEAEVMKRPITRQGLIHANWFPGETMAQLEAETERAG